jgi:hypothetical protein
VNNPNLLRSTCVRLLLATVFLLSSVFLRAQGATGAIEGRIFDPRRGEYLPKARVTIDGLKEETLSDNTGQYRIANVPAGAVTVRIFYTGRAIQTEQVTVLAGKTVQRDITMVAPGAPATAADTVKLDAFVVASSKQMDGAALAINEQRFAKNIVNVVSADEFGTIADGSIGEFMKFLPGITSDYTGGDARRFSINGAPAGNVPISMGGFDMASAAGAGTGRQVELDQVSINKALGRPETEPLDSTRTAIRSAPASSGAALLNSSAASPLSSALLSPCSSTIKPMLQVMGSSGKGFTRSARAGGGVE